MTLIDDTDRLIEYSVAMERMQELWQERLDGARPDTLWLLSHEQIFTAGVRTDEGDFPAPEAGIPVLMTRRGGQLTYHGPGQLVGYLIVKLQPGEGVVDYIREVENRLVEAIGKLGVPAERRDTPPGSELLTGVWTADTRRKITSIGMRVGRNITTHGFALNVDGDLTPWSLAVACGMPDVDMTSIHRELTEAGSPPPDFPTAARTIAEAFDAS
ncbi:lipoyl(octanoyl) transferase LipB [Actinocorallia lasiicapitis]